MEDNASKSLVRIKDMQTCELNERVSINAVVREIKEIDTTGKSYDQTMVVIEDRTGDTSFPIWKSIDVVKRDLVEGGMYTFYGVIGEWRGYKQLKYSSVKLLPDTEENRVKIDPAYIKGVTKEQEDAFKKVIESRIQDDRYRRLCEVAFGLGEVPEGVDEKEYRSRYESFKGAWCSISYHDNYSGGLFNHTMGIVRLCLALKKIYGDAKGRIEKGSNINWDHLLTLALLHDYEKQKEYIPNGRRCDYDPEVLVDHVAEGVARIEILNKEVEEDLKLTKKEIERLKYGILCHHGSYGRYEPKSNEDKIFHALDVIDTANVEELVIE